MKKNTRIGIFGGAFDPIHFGHLALAHTCLKFLSLDQVRFLPTRQPILKQPCIAKPWQRAAMTALAIINEPSFILDLRELISNEPSYTLLTLQSLTQEFPCADIYWLLGEDAFSNFTRWHRWQDIAKLCNLVVVSRQLHEQVDAKRAVVKACFEAAHHQVIDVQMSHINIASSDIRSEVNPHLQDLPDAVQRYILENRLY